MSHQKRNQVASLAASMSQRQRNILTAFAELRYLSTAQVTRLVFGGFEVTEASAQRMARRELAQMAEARILVKLDHRAGYDRASNRSHVYGVGTMGRRAIEVFRGRGVPRGWTYQEPGGPFVEHTLAVAELYVRLKEAERQGVFTVESFDGEPTAWRSYIGAGGTTSHLKPDAFTLTAQGEFQDSWFIEMDLATERRGAIERKLRAYLSYFRSGVEQTRTGVFPQVIWLVPDLARRQFMEDIIGRIGGPKELFTVAVSSEEIEAFAGGEHLS